MRIGLRVAGCRTAARQSVGFAAEFERTANDNHEALAKLAATVSNAGGLVPTARTIKGRLNETEK